MSRRGGYPTAELYEERERDFYARPRTERNYDDLDVELDITRSSYQREPVRRAETVVSDRRSVRPGPGRQPDFLREDYGRTNAGPLVVREREREIDEFSERGGPARTVRSERPERTEKARTVIEEDRRSEWRPPRRDRSEYGEVDKEEIIIRRGEREPERPRAREREVEKEEIIIRRGEREPERPRPREREVEKEEIIIRRGEREPEPPREREREVVEERDLVIRRSESEVRPRPREVREYDREEIRFRRGGGDRGPPPIREREVEREEIIFQERRSPPPAREREEIREEVIFRDRERSRGPPPPRERSYGPVAREREEFVFRRRMESPPRARETEKEEIIIRQRRQITPPREPSPEPEPPREPSPEPLPPVIRPPIVQEIITHHRHIDHGVERARSERARSLTPPPPPPSPPRPREDNLEIEIRRKRRDEDGKTVFDEDIIFERDTLERKERNRSRETNRRRSLSASTRRRSPSPIRRRYEDDIEAEADFYNRRVASRGYMGEAYNGATKDWAIVDVPPGTERVQMDGIGGASQEVTWQRYNGVRRSKFKTREQVYESEFGVGSGPGREEVREEVREERRETPRAAKEKDKMWTEITKDLVLKEAITERGWDFEETEYFYYVMEYLKYEDVLGLVELSEDIRRERRERLREIQWEREQMERLPALLPAPPPAPKSVYDERIYEREYVYDRNGGRRYR